MVNANFTISFHQLRVSLECLKLMFEPDIQKSIKWSVFKKAYLPSVLVGITEADSENIGPFKYDL